MHFSGKIGQIIGWRPPFGVSAPSSGISWIRHWYGIKGFVEKVENNMARHKKKYQGVKNFTLVAHMQNSNYLILNQGLPMMDIQCFKSVLPSQ